MFSKVTQHYNTPCMLACWREINVSLKKKKNWAWLTRNVSFDSQVMLESHEILTLRQQLAESLAEKTTTTIQNLIQSGVQIPNFIDWSFESAHLSFFNVMLNWNERFIYPLWCSIPSNRVLFHFVSLSKLVKLQTHLCVIIEYICDLYCEYIFQILSHLF